MAFPPPHSSPSSYYPSLDEFHPPLYTPNPSVDLYLPPPPPYPSSTVDNSLPPQPYPSSAVDNSLPPLPYPSSAADNFLQPPPYPSSAVDNSLPPPYPSYAENVYPFKSNAAAIQNNFFASSQVVDHSIINVDDGFLPQDLAGIVIDYFPSPGDDFNFDFNLDDLSMLDDDVPVNGDWRLNQLNLPPGVKFRPTDEELITHYLKRRVHGEPGPFGFGQGQPEPITHVDVYDYEPKELEGMGQDHGDGKRYFYTYIEKMAKQLNSKKIKGKQNFKRTIKSNKGNWRPTQKATKIKGGNGITIGNKTPLAYHDAKGKSQWLMQEFKLESYPDSHQSSRELAVVVVYYHDRRKGEQDNNSRKRKKDEDDEN